MEETKPKDLKHKETVSSLSSHHLSVNFTKNWSNELKFVWLVQLELECVRGRRTEEIRGTWLDFAEGKWECESMQLGNSTYSLSCVYFNAKCVSLDQMDGRRSNHVWGAAASVLSRWRGCYKLCSNRMMRWKCTCHVSCPDWATFPTSSQKKIIFLKISTRLMVQIILSNYDPKYLN